MTVLESTRTSGFDWRLALKCVLGFVALHLVYRWVLLALAGRLGSILDLSVACSALLEIALGLGFCSILGAVARRGLATGLAAAVVLALPTGVTFAAGDLASRYFLSADANRKPPLINGDAGTMATRRLSGERRDQSNGQARRTFTELPSTIKERARKNAVAIIALNVSTSYFVFFGLGAFFVGMSSARRLRAAERKASDFERLAQSSQLRALRYQVNPHFLFNTLNSISSLIMARRLDEAESMILNLSAFFRSSLAIDPTEDVPLREEIRLQRLYLDIEHARFPGRLHVNVTLPPPLEAVHVPALLLQPLIENAIKYSLGQTSERVTIEIIAESLGDDAMRLIVEDSGGGGGHIGPNPGGGGVGLSNVRERLHARFGTAASFDSGFRSGGGYRVTITLPVTRP